MTKHKCPVCGRYEFDDINSYDVCDVCGWEDDKIQEDNPDEENCANIMSLNQMKKAWKMGMDYDKASEAYERGEL